LYCILANIEDIVTHLSMPLSQLGFTTTVHSTLVSLPYA